MPGVVLEVVRTRSSALLLVLAACAWLVPGRAGAQPAPATQFFGGSAGRGEAVVVDTDGSVFVAGSSTHADTATTPTDPCQSKAAAAGSDTAHGTAFVAKLDASGACQFFTYLGGTGQDSAFALAVDASGVYATGVSNSPDFPATGPPAGANDAWAARFDKATGAVVWATLIGSSADEAGFGVAVAGGNVYVSGSVNPTADQSATLPATNCAAQPAFAGGQGDAFVALLDAASGAITRTTYLGGSGADSSFGTLAADATGVYVTGTTDSIDFPTSPGAPYPNILDANGTTDAFVTKLDPQLTTRLYSTFLGGLSDDQGQAITVDETGAAYVAGQTASPFPVTTTTLKASATTTTSTTSTSTTMVGCALASTTTSTTNTLPTSTTSTVPKQLHALRGSNGNTDAFVAKIDPTGTALAWATHVGGSASDRATAVTVDAAHHVLLAGDTASKKFTKLDKTGGTFKTFIYGPNTTKSKSCPEFLRPCRDSFVMELDANGLPCALDAAGACPKSGGSVTPLFFATMGGTGPDLQPHLATSPAGDIVWVAGIAGNDDNARCQVTPKPNSCKGKTFKPFRVTIGGVSTPSTPPGFPGDDAVDYGAFLVELPKPAAP